MVESAFIGHPPATEEDFYIVKSYLRLASKYSGKFNADPTKGIAPGMKPPPGYVYHDKQAGILVALSVMLVFIFFLTATRLSLRLFVQRLKWGPDDWAIIPATLGMMTYLILQILVVTLGGGGKHIWDVRYKEFAKFLEIGFGGRTTFYISIGLVKISIALFNRRLTVIASRPWRLFNEAFLVVSVIYVILVICLNFFQCNPPRVMFDKVYDGKLEQPAKCIDSLVVGRFSSFAHVTLDFILLITPVVVIWKVKMSRSKRWRLLLLFSVGTLTCVTSVLRDRLGGATSLDTTYVYTNFVCWAVLDLGLSLFVANMPVLNALFSLRKRRSNEAEDTGIDSLATINVPNTSESFTKTSATATSRDIEEDAMIHQDAVQVTYHTKDGQNGIDPGKDSTTSGNAHARSSI